MKRNLPINDMTMQIASAAEEQHQVAEEIAKNIEAINMLSKETAQYASNAAQAGIDVAQLSKDLDLMVEQFDDANL